MNIIVCDHTNVAQFQTLICDYTELSTQALLSKPRHQILLLYTENEIELSINTNKCNKQEIRSEFSLTLRQLRESPRRPRGYRGG